MRLGHFKQVPQTYGRGRGLSEKVSRDGILLSVDKTWAWSGDTQAEEGEKRILRNLILASNYFPP